MKHNLKQKLKRIRSGIVIGNASKVTEYAEYCNNGLVCTEIFPLNCEAILKHIFEISDRPQSYNDTGRIRDWRSSISDFSRKSLLVDCKKNTDLMEFDIPRSLNSPL